MSAVDPRPIEVRLETAFDRFNRAVILGMEPSSLLFMEALEAEGLRLSLSVPETLDVTAPQAPGTEEPARQASRLVPGRARALF